MKSAQPEKQSNPHLDMTTVRPMLASPRAQMAFSTLEVVRAVRAARALFGLAKNTGRARIRQAAAFLCMLLAAAAAVGQNNRLVLKANIPFPFVVANRTLPAGHYELSPVGEAVLRVANAAQPQAFALALASGTAGHVSRGTGKLVFSRYGGTYFLSQVWQPNSGTGKLIYKSHAEAELARKAMNRGTATLRAEK